MHYYVRNQTEIVAKINCCKANAVDILLSAIQI